MTHSARPVTARKHHLVRTLIFFSLLSLSIAAQAQLNVLMYHHVSDATPASTSTKVAQFQAHLDYLAEHHTVVDLVGALEAIRSGEPLPDHAVALTFDDAYISVYDTAWPMMAEYDFPFTVFVATQPVDRDSSITMSWDQLREIHAAGARLLNHTHGHEYLVRTDAYDEAWLESTLASIDQGEQRLAEELGVEPAKVFAYPYGEYSRGLQNLVAEAGYVALGQHSGGIAVFSDWQALPRFAAGGNGADLNTLRTKLQSRPLPVEHPLPDPVTSELRPVLQTRLIDHPDVRWSALNCFTGAGRAIPFSLVNGVLTTQVDTDLTPGRQRYNCTAPARSGGYYWLSHQWLIGQGPADY